MAIITCSKSIAGIVHPLDQLLHRLEFQDALHRPENLLPAYFDHQLLKHFQNATLR